MFFLQPCHILWENVDLSWACSALMRLKIQYCRHPDATTQQQASRPFWYEPPYHCMWIVIQPCYFNKNVIAEVLAGYTHAISKWRKRRSTRGFTVYVGFILNNNDISTLKPSTDKEGLRADTSLFKINNLKKTPGLKCHCCIKDHHYGVRMCGS